MAEKGSKATIKELKSEAVHTESVPRPEQQDRSALFRIMLVVLASGFTLLTFLVKIMPSIAVDLQITRAIQMINNSEFDFVMRVISWPGFAPQSVIITILIGMLLYLMGLRWEGIMTVVASLLSTGINVLAKNLIQRPRPSSDLVNVLNTFTSYSFPSGHVMFYLGLFGFIGFVVFSLFKPSLKRSVLLLIFGIPVVLIGPSRIYLGAHWISDVLGAYLLGTLTLIAIIQIYLWDRARFFVNQTLTASSSIKDIKYVKGQ